MTIIGRSHGGPRQKREQRRRAAACFRALRHAGIVEVVATEAVQRARSCEVSAELQRDFSLHQTLSLYLLETLGKLDRESPDYALDVLTLVESILENPDAVLRKQLDKLKTEKMAELKAEGVEYEQRIEELEAMEWPKPNRDFIYETFNDFADRHPWVGTENMQPKSVAREMYEGFASFDDYVRSLGARAERGRAAALPVAGLAGAGRDGAGARAHRRGRWTSWPTSARCSARSTPACSRSGRR